MRCLVLRHRGVRRRCLATSRFRGHGFFSGSNRAARQNRAGGGREAPNRLAPDPINPARAPSAQPLDRPVLRAALWAIGWPENPGTVVDGNRCMLPTLGQTPSSARRRPIPRINLQRRNSPSLSSRTGLVQQTGQIAAARDLSILVRPHCAPAERNARLEMPTEFVLAN